MGEPKIYIFYPDTKEISYFGIPKTYKDKIDENRYKVIRNKNGTVEIKEIRKKSKVPVLMMTSYNDEQYKITAFSSLCDRIYRKTFLSFIT